MPGRLRAEISTVERASRVYALVRIHAPQGEVVPARPPLNLALLLDRSGSMFGEKLRHAVDACKFLISQLSPRDRLSVVVYDERVDTLVAPTLVENKDEIRIKLDRILPGGTTNLSGAWLRGASLVEAFARPEQVNRVLLITDGIANEGIIDPRRLTDIVRSKRLAGVTTTTFGLGADFNEDLLLAMAEAGGGNYYFIENPDQSPRIFAHELRGLLQIQAQNLCICVDAGADVKLIDCLNGYPTRDISGELEIWLGDIYAEESKVLCIEMVVPAKPDLGETRLATLRFEYDQIVPDVEHRSYELPLLVNRRAEQDLAAVRELSLFRAARAKEHSVNLADRGDLGAASAVLKDASLALRTSAPELDGALAREVHDLEALAEQLDRHDYSNLDRKRLFTTTYYQKRGKSALFEPPEGAEPQQPGEEQEP